VNICYAGNYYYNKGYDGNGFAYTKRDLQRAVFLKIRREKKNIVCITYLKVFVQKNLNFN
ncbi:hypothetical protein DOY81_008223, partial [Sarcophaga bullata]